MKNSFYFSAVIALLAAMSCSAQSGPPSSVLPAGLPDVLTMSDGSKVTTATEWQARRAELRRLFTQQMYGEAPPRPESERFQVIDDTRNALRGAATRKQVTILLKGTADGPALHLLLYIPNHVHHPPVFLGINFLGNETVNADPGILISHWRQTTSKPPPTADSAPCPIADLHLKDRLPTAACRGIARDRWPIDLILKRGYAVATIPRPDVDPDYLGSFEDTLEAFYPQLQGWGDNFSTIGGWAWAMSRVMDYLQTDHDVDATRVAGFGWSRLGKAALWAGATDDRFALVISDDSGAGGAKLFRRGLGETIRDLNTVFPDWFCNQFKQYNDRDRTLPFDQHMVIAMIAPRPVYIADAIDDLHADPEGEFLSALAASPVYKLLGTDGLPVTQWPPVNHPVMGQIGYHVRSGGHGITLYDWQQYLKFADMHLQAQKP